MFEPQHCNTPPDYSCPSCHRKFHCRRLWSSGQDRARSGHLPPDSRSPMELYFTVCSSLPSASLNHASVHRCRHSLVLQCCKGTINTNCSGSSHVKTNPRLSWWRGCRLSLLQTFPAAAELHCKYRAGDQSSLPHLCLSPYFSLQTNPTLCVNTKEFGGGSWSCIIEYLLK